jgi:predicted Zn-dependent peptidase
MTRTLAKGSLLLALGLLSGGAPAAAQGGAVDIPFETYQLANGLKVILAPDPTSPVVAVDVWYDVGSRNEQRGLTGFAHLFEHMMFEGSANVGKGDHMKLLQRAGASNLNGTTSDDRTNYYEVVPANRVNLALWLEADRMRSLNVTAENLANQKEVVKEERRMRIDNAPYQGSIRHLISTASYDTAGCFAYGHESIGSMDDLNASKLEDVQAFFKMYYAPNNATIALAGDFDTAEVKRLIEEYFGSIPRGTPTPPVTCENAFAHFPQRDTIQDRNATLPAYLAAYGTVPFAHPDKYALELLGNVLAGGDASRMHQRMVKQERAATFVLGGAFPRRGPGLFAVYTIANQGVDAGRLEALADEEIEKVRTSGVTEAELQRAKNQYRTQTVRGLETAFGRVEALQQFALFGGDPALIRGDLEKYMAVTPADIQRVARQYLAPTNRVVIHTVPAPKS